jgi:hypothetical protein
MKAAPERASGAHHIGADCCCRGDPMTAVASLDARPRCRNPRCGKARRKLANGRTEGSCGLCWACYDRWRDSGRGVDVPDAMTHAERTALAAEAVREAMWSRIGDYELIRSRGASRPETARRVGVSVKHTYVYDKKLRRGEGAGHAA